MHETLQLLHHAVTDNEVRTVLVVLYLVSVYLLCAVGVRWRSIKSRLIVTTSLTDIRDTMVALHYTARLTRGYQSPFFVDAGMPSYGYPPVLRVTQPPITTADTVTLGPRNGLLFRPVYLHRAWHRRFVLWMRNQPAPFPMLPLVGTSARLLPSPAHQNAEEYVAPLGDEPLRTIVYNYLSGPRPQWLFQSKRAWDEKMGWSVSFDSPDGTEPMLFYITLHDWATQPREVVTALIALIEQGGVSHPQVVSFE